MNWRYATRRATNSVSSKVPSNLSGTEMQLTHLTLLSRIRTQGQRSLIGQGDSEDLTLLRSGGRENYCGL